MTYAVILDYTINQIPHWGTFILFVCCIIAVILLSAACPEEGYLKRGFFDFILLSIVGVCIYLPNVYLNGSFCPPSKALFLIDAILILRGSYLCFRSVVALYAVPLGIAISFLLGYLLSLVLAVTAYFFAKMLFPAIVVTAALVVLYQKARMDFLIHTARALINGERVSFVEISIFVKELFGKH